MTISQTFFSNPHELRNRIKMLSVVPIQLSSKSFEICCSIENKPENRFFPENVRSSC